MRAAMLITLLSLTAAVEYEFADEADPALWLTPLLARMGVPATALASLFAMAALSSTGTARARPAPSSMAT